MASTLNEFDCYEEWLALPDGPRPPGHYELLGLTPGENDPVSIKAASLERTAKVRRYCLGQHGTEATRLLGELAAAFACLSDPTAKAAYDRQLNSDHKTNTDTAPPVQHDEELLDDEAPPRHARADVPKAPKARRSSPWLKRPRLPATPGPAHFILTAAVLLAATCGVVWSSRRPTLNDARQDVAAGIAPASAVIKAPGPAQPPAPKVPIDEARPSLPAPVVSNKSTAAPDGPAPGDTKPTNDAPTRAEVPPVAAADKTDKTDDATGVPSAARADDANPFLELSPALAKKPDMPPALPESLDKEQNAEQRGDTPLAPAEAQDNGRVLPPNELWRLSTGDEPELLEVTFDSPVDAAHVELLEPSLPAKIERAIIEAPDGSQTELRPVEVFYHDGVRRWSFGASRRARTERFRLRFRPTEDGYVELAGVAVLDRMGNQHPPVLVRAVSEAGEGAKPKPPDALEQFDEVAAQSLLEKAKKQPTVAAYAAVLKSYPKTSAAVEAVRALAEIIATLPRSGTASFARKALDRLVTHFPDSDAAKEVPDALREATPASPAQPEPNQFRLPDGPPRRPGPGPRFPGPPF